MTLQKGKKESQKPTILVTRKLLDAVEERLKKDHDARLNEEDKPYTTEGLLNKTEGADALFITMDDRLNTDVIKQLPDRIACGRSPPSQSTTTTKINRHYRKFLE